MFADVREAQNSGHTQNGYSEIVFQVGPLK